MYELLRSSLLTKASTSNLYEFAVLGPAPGRFPSNVGFLCDKSGFQYVSFGDDDLVARYTREAIVTLDEVYCGESSVVHKALFMPTLSFLCVKTIPINSSSKRAAVASEIRVLYSHARSELVLQNGHGSSHGSGCTGAPTHLFEDVLPASPEGRPSCPSHSPTSDSKRPSKSSSPSRYLCTFYDAFIDQERGGVSIVLKNYAGGSLQDHLNEGLRFSYDEVTVIAYSVLSALEELKGFGIVHRDVKPSNMLMDSKGQIVLCDYGIAKTLRGPQLKCTTFCGTLFFMAPERLFGASSYSFTADTWSLGVSLLLLISGSLPWGEHQGFGAFERAIKAGTAVPAVIKTSYPLLGSFIDQCLTLDPALRPDFATLLQHPLMASAVARGVFDPTATVHLTNRRKPVVYTTSEISSIIEECISWQLSLLEKRELDRRSNFDCSGASPPRLARYSDAKIKWLAQQCGVQDWHVVGDLFEARCLEVDAIMQNLQSAPVSPTSTPQSSKGSPGIFWDDDDVEEVEEEKTGSAKISSPMLTLKTLKTTTSAPVREVSLVGRISSGLHLTREPHSPTTPATARGKSDASARRIADLATSKSLCLEIEGQTDCPSRNRSGSSASASASEAGSDGDATSRTGPSSAGSNGSGGGLHLGTTAAEFTQAVPQAGDLTEGKFLDQVYGAPKLVNPSVRPVRLMSSEELSASLGMGKK